ncbi:carnitine O-acetyltransferase CAT2 Ecym_5463 [Eremothecium cymbalariae DBVPG|uniref:Carnitine O-acetyltransferase, mitochondrial n=1 Tax=Eremothecium cymbalariae (strain CBS 270.75 / DBVPG 7215 / KCTC 17166 / NRRL Y-17582) TaxID=931890 RepID=I6NDS0_ERECY|nr:hypothetical protein Ecym_5463 [Eremothecium cymbalariae DBVPG\
MIKSKHPQVVVRRMVSALKSYQFETKNGEHYVAKHQNAYYQSKRVSFKGETFSKQAALPSLPVPELSSTIQKYLDSVAPLCKTEEEVERQRYLCSEFLKKQGPVLHSRLLEHSKDKRNWMSEFWDNQSYLEYNDPIVPYVSYFFGHKPLPITHKAIDEDYLVKATAIITTVVKFIEVLKDEAIPPEVIKGSPFCMNSFQLMFNTSRIPGKGRDSNVFYSIYENDFVTVAYKGNYYKVFTHDSKTGKPLAPAQIWKQLYDVVHKVSASVREDTNAGVGLLTTLPRDEWHAAYSSLMTNSLSRSSLETIHRSSFLLALDSEQRPISLEDKARNNWHGDGVNRFNDKAVQFFVCGNGVSGFLAEHSKMDGTPNLFLNQYVCQELLNLDPNEFADSIKSGLSSEEHLPVHLPFVLTPFIQSIIASARTAFHEVIGEHDLRVWNYIRYGKKTIKGFGFSPDAYIQQIIQLAVYKYLGKQLPTYEAGSTRKYFKGRTETGRSVSSASAEFVKTWQSPKATPAEKISALRESARFHSNYLAMAADGQGIDRHFFGMKNMLKPDDEVPELFKDPLFQYSCTWLVSTSQLSSEYFEGYGWSQVNENGFGLAYMLNNDWMNINIVTKPKKSGYDVNEFHYCLTQAANEMYELLSREAQSKAKL